MKQRAGFFFYKKSSIFPLDLPEKAIFWPQTNTSHLIKSVQKPNYRKTLKVTANCENLQGYRPGVLGEGFSATKTYGSKTTNHSQLAWPFELHVKQTLRHIAWDWFIFSCSQTRCLAVSDPVFLINFAFRKMSFISILWWQQSWNRKRKTSVFENSKIKDSSRKKKRARCFVSSRD